MEKKLYEYKSIPWEYHSRGNFQWVIPFCPVHRMELRDYNNSPSGFCDDCNKHYAWNEHPDSIAQYLRRKLASKAYQEAEIVTIDGIQTPQLKVKAKIPEENEEYWIEAKLNNSTKGRQLVLYAGEKGRSGKAQIFANIDQEKLSFDHNDRKPEEIFAIVTVQFPSGKKMSIEAPKDND